jgi:hypothetical protein
MDKLQWNFYAAGHKAGQDQLSRRYAAQPSTQRDQSR